MDDVNNSVEDILIGIGLMYDNSRMIDDDDIYELIGEWSFERFPKFGERAWKAIGDKKTLILWDCGNHWYQIITES